MRMQGAALARCKEQQLLAIEAPASGGEHVLVAVADGEEQDAQSGEIALVEIRDIPAEPAAIDARLRRQAGAEFRCRPMGEWRQVELVSSEKAFAVTKARLMSLRRMIPSGCPA